MLELLQSIAMEHKTKPVTVSIAVIQRLTSFAFRKLAERKKMTAKMEISVSVTTGIQKSGS